MPGLAGHLGRTPDPTLPGNAVLWLLLHHIPKQPKNGISARLLVSAAAAVAAAAVVASAVVATDCCCCCLGSLRFAQRGS